MTDQNSSPNSSAPNNVAYFSDGNVLRDIGRLEAKVERISELEKDVSKLKEWRSYMMGLAAAASFIVPLIMKYFGLL